MSTELVKISRDDRGKPAVYGRELHAALEVETKYATWLDRMVEYGFEEGKDYFPILGNRSDGLPGKPSTDHALSLDMAKHLAMIQRTEKGKQVRQYFIECEAAYREQPVIPGPAPAAKETTYRIDGHSFTLPADRGFQATTTESGNLTISVGPVGVQPVEAVAASLPVPTRFVFLSNEVPRLADASGALASRFVVLKLTESFYGREDLQLEEKLTAELPAILNMAIRSLRDLLKRGRFIQPKSALPEVEMMEDLGSPIGRFVKERCQVGPRLWVASDDLWNAWKEWCDDEGINAVGAKATFFRNLNAAISGIVNRKRSDLAGSRFRAYGGIALNR